MVAHDSTSSPDSVLTDPTTRQPRTPHRRLPRGAHSGGGHGLPHGPAARVPCGEREVSSQCALADSLHRPTDSASESATLYGSYSTGHNRPRSGQSRERLCRTMPIVHRIVMPIRRSFYVEASTL